MASTNHRPSCIHTPQTPVLFFVHIFFVKLLQTKQSQKSIVKYVNDLRKNFLDMNKGHAIQFYECKDCPFIKTRDERTFKRHHRSVAL